MTLSLSLQTLISTAGGLYWDYDKLYWNFTQALLGYTQTRLGCTENFINSIDRPRAIYGDFITWNHDYEAPGHSERQRAPWVCAAQPCMGLIRKLTQYPITSYYNLIFDLTFILSYFTSGSPSAPFSIRILIGNHFIVEFCKIPTPTSNHVQ